MTNFTESYHEGGYIVSEAWGSRSRDQIVVKSGADLKAGTILGKTLTGAQTVAAAVAFAGNTGNGTVGSLTADAQAEPGDWKIVIVDQATNAGAFEVLKPDGSLDGTGHVAAAYNGGINFTLADGATDFVGGDGFTVNVSYAAGEKFAAHDPAATDGTQKACAILYGDANAASADVPATAHVRDMEYNAAEVIWKTGISAADKAAGVAALAALGMIGR